MNIVETYPWGYVFEFGGVPADPEWDERSFLHRNGGVNGKPFRYVVVGDLGSNRRHCFGHHVTVERARKHMVDRYAKYNWMPVKGRFWIERLPE